MRRQKVPLNVILMLKMWFEKKGFRFQVSGFRLRKTDPDTPGPDLVLYLPCKGVIVSY